ncbi:MAG: 50S ribosomal protein L15 [candidate division WOR-3 bacterium]
MTLSNLRPNPGAKKRKKRVGRGIGSGHGKTSGRGTKGAGARSGKEKGPWFEGGQTPLYRRLPKKGFKNPFKREYAIVNIETLSKKFNENEEVNPQILIERRIVKKKLPVKVLGKGEINKPIILKVHAISSSAKEKIEKAGGKVEIIEEK